MNAPAGFRLTAIRAASARALGRGAFATPASSPSADGSSALSRRRARFALALLINSVALLTLAGFASASKEAIFFIGESGSLSGRAGELRGPLGVAVNSTGVGSPQGTVYVADQNNHRIHVFDKNGTFVSVWGKDVIAPTVDERQRIQLVDAAAGTYTLNFDGSTTAPIDYNAGAAAIDDALDSLPTIGGDANVNVSALGGAFIVTFQGALAAADQPQISADTTDLAGTIAITTLADGTAATGDTGTGYEVCTFAPACKIGIASGGDGTMAGNGTVNQPQAVAVDGDTGNVYVSDRNNRRINAYDASGDFLFSVGRDVADPNGGAAVEICVDGIDICRAGDAGAGAGDIGSGTTSSTFDIAVSPPDGSAATGSIYLADTGNRRVNTYDLDGGNPASFGSAANFGTTQPRKVAVDSRGIVYASDSNNGGEVDRYDSLNANGGGIGFIASIPAPPLLAGAAATASSGLAVDPDSDGGGPDEDILYVLRDPSLESTVVQQFGPINDPGLSTAPSAVDDTHGNGAGMIATGNLGVDSQASRLFVSSPGGFGNTVLVLDDSSSVPPPGVTLSAVTVKTDTTATLRGNVDPKGGLVKCTFEYSTDQTKWTDLTEPDCDSIPLNSGFQAVSEKVTGLTPNSHYFVRFAVSRPFIANSTVTSSLRSFATDSVPPVVTDVGAIQVTDGSARLVGTIDPRNSGTGYVFEYGTTEALGSSTPPVSIGGGTTPITVSQVIEGLSNDTPYHFRLRATNAFGDTLSDQKSFRTRALPLPDTHPGDCANEEIRVAQASTYLPDCRAFEMVSPADKNNGALADSIAFSRDGDGAAFCPPFLFGEPPPQQTFICGQYISKRTAQGWRTLDALPRACVTDVDKRREAQIRVYLSTASFDRAAFVRPEYASCQIPPLDPAASSGANLYRADFTTDPFGFDLLTPASISLNPVRSPIHGLFAGGSDDFEHIVYMSRGAQTPDTPADDVHRLYDWEEEGHGGCVQPGGCLSLLSVDESGDPLAGKSRMPAVGEGGSSTPIASSVSADGERIYFQNQVSGPDFDSPAGGCVDETCDLYLREGGAETLHVSASECTLGAACGGDTSPALFRWANPTGDKALFVSCAKLTDASAEPKSCEVQLSSPVAGNQLKLYRWDRNAPEGSRLVDLTVDEEAADGAQPRALEPIGGSDDGDVVYFVAGGQIVSGASLDPGLKLYRWRWNGGSPSVDYLGPYLSATESGGENDGHVIDDPNANRRHVRVTPDGRYLVIQTKLRYDPAADRDADADLYRWDEDGGWLCVSCQLPGAPSAGHVSALDLSPRFNGLIEDLVSQEPERTISDDGERVFFSTPDALVPEDVNGEAGCPDSNFAGGRLYACQDVYEWHDGTLSLLTTGTGSEPFLLAGATKTGRDVFFTTEQRLVGWDTDDQTDLYVARSSGGFPEPPPAPVPCEGEECRGEGSEAADVPGAGSAVFRGAPNPDRVSNPCGAISRKAKRKRAAARKAARKGQAKRARALHRQARNLNRRAKRCNRRQGR